MLSVALLRHFFFLRVTGGHISGCTNFIAAGQANSISNTGKRVDNIRAKMGHDKCRVRPSTIGTADGGAPV